MHKPLSHKSQTKVSLPIGFVAQCMVCALALILSSIPEKNRFFLIPSFFFSLCLVNTYCYSLYLQSCRSTKNIRNNSFIHVHAYQLQLCMYVLQLISMFVYIIKTTIIIIAHINNAFCATKRWIAPKLPNDWLVTMNKKTPTLQQ